MNLRLKQNLDKLVRANLLISTGCTEPIAIAYAVATARRTLGDEPVSITLRLSGNMAKNAMDAGVPGSNYVGAAFVAALGALYADPDSGFELLVGMSEEQQENAYQFSREHVEFEIADTDEPLYIEAILKSEASDCTNTARVLVVQNHTNVVENEFNGTSVMKNESTEDTGGAEKGKEEEVKFTMKDIYDYVDELDDFSLFKMAVSKNFELSEEGKKNHWGLDVGKMHPFGEETTFSRVVAAATSGVDARMAGAEKPAVACTGSGNQGITITLPIAQLAREKRLSEAETLKAVAVGILSAIYVKRHLNVLSHLCGAVIAGSGAAAGMTYVLGGTHIQAECAIINVLSSVVGMFCDGAKNTCALKVAACVSMAIYAANLAMTQTGCITKRVGIVFDTIEDTIMNIAKIETNSADVMNETILKIITTSPAHSEDIPETTQE